MTFDIAVAAEEEVEKNQAHHSQTTKNDKRRFAKENKILLGRHRWSYEKKSCLNKEKNQVCY